jgi:RsiW-degrading membrane proteinase PrsW (M82 family)
MREKVRSGDDHAAAPVIATCRVCELPAEHLLGAYALCERHYALATRERRGLWRVGLLAILGLFALIVVAQLVSPLIPAGAQPSPALFLAGIVLAIAPAGVWLWLSYQQDRIEPEPRGMVLGVFALGALLAAAIGVPLVRDVFDVSAWMLDDMLVRLVGGFLVVGMIQSLLKYVAVRFSVYASAEFDEATDGILYGTAAGLGYATVLNLDLILQSGGAALGFAAIQVAVTALAHAAFGGVIGYFISGQRLSRKPVWWSALGIVIAAALTSLFHASRALVIAGNASIGGVLIGPWLGLIVSAIFAAVAFGAVIAAVRREIRRLVAVDLGHVQP